MKRFVLGLVFVFAVAGFLPAQAYADLSTGYSSLNLKNEEAMFDASSEIFFLGAGASLGIEGYLGGLDSKWLIGANYDFFIKSKTAFARNGVQYQIQNEETIDDGRFSAYTAYALGSAPVYFGIGLGYAMNRLGFDMQSSYDTDYASYNLVGHAITPSAFFRLDDGGRFYISLNYEADITLGGKLERTGGSPLVGYNFMDGAKLTPGVSHRVRLAIGIPLVWAVIPLLFL